jgi:ABC-type lipoprotein release transport system permease subunit
MYVHAAQEHVSSAFVQVRTARDPNALMSELREAVRQVDPNLPLMNISSQREQIELRFAQEKLLARACVLFGSAALLLATIGLFGLMSYSVARRTNEIGIRMAVGARAADVWRMVLAEAMRPVFVGIVVGLTAAIAGGRMVSAVLYGVAPVDVPTFTLVVAVLVAAAGIAGYFPARRATRVDPLTALRHE